MALKLADSFLSARLAQSVERQSNKLAAVGSSPTVGNSFCLFFLFLFCLNFSYEEAA